MIYEKNDQGRDSDMETIWNEVFGETRGVWRLTKLSTNSETVMNAAEVLSSTADEDGCCYEMKFLEILQPTQIIDEWYQKKNQKGQWFQNDRKIYLELVDVRNRVAYDIVTLLKQY